MYFLNEIFSYKYFSYKPWHTKYLSSVSLFLVWVVLVLLFCFLVLVLCFFGFFYFFPVDFSLFPGETREGLGFLSSGLFWATSVQSNERWPA